MKRCCWIIKQDKTLREGHFKSQCILVYSHNPLFAGHEAISHICCELLLVHTTRSPASTCCIWTHQNPLTTAFHPYLLHTATHTVPIQKSLTTNWLKPHIFKTALEKVVFRRNHRKKKSLFALICWITWKLCITSALPVVASIVPLWKRIKKIEEEQ